MWRHLITKTNQVVSVAQLVAFALPNLKGSGSNPPTGYVICNMYFALNEVNVYILYVLCIIPSVRASTYKVI